jgi:5-methylcytosine-specific restriction endonuclease McrA
MKICSKCKTEKSTLEFSKLTRNKGGLNHRCKSCCNAALKKFRDNNPWVSTEEISRRRAERYRVNSKEILERSKIRRLERIRENPEILKEESIRKNRYKQLNPEVINANTADRRAKKLNATPAFADKKKIKELYKQAKDLTKSTGVEYQVDHIVPLRHPLVSGLHWEGNLQVITAEENLKKSNRYWPDMPDEG